MGSPVIFFSAFTKFLTKALQLRAISTTTINSLSPMEGAIAANSTTHRPNYYNGTIWTDLQGPQGSQGSQGTAGSQGAQGSQGNTGSQGSTGVQGSQGTTGAQGSTGAQGTQGSQGSTGSQGTAGTNGTNGTNGSQGAQGFQGDVGSQGSTGAQGSTGSQGTTGAQGSQGSQGTAGSTGAQGSQGSAGAQGSQGSQGTQGTQGTQGSQGTSGTAAQDASYDLQNLTITAAPSANALVITMLTKAGSNPSAGSPVNIGFRSNTLATGTYNLRTVTSALSVTIPSGATLGQQASVAEPIYVYAYDNGGTIGMAVSTARLDETVIQTSSAFGGGSPTATSRTTLYSATGLSGLPIRLIAKIVSTQTVPGTWGNPTQESLLPIQDIATNTLQHGLIDGSQSIDTTGGGTTTLTNISPPLTIFTGNSTQTLKLPNTSTCIIGQIFKVSNLSTNANPGSVIIQTSTAVGITSLSQGFGAEWECVSTSVNTAAAWSQRGNTGERIVVNNWSASASQSSGNEISVASQLIPSGVWMLGGAAFIIPATANSLTNAQLSFSTTNNSSDYEYFNRVAGTAIGTSCPQVSGAIALTTATTYYLVAYATTAVSNWSFGAGFGSSGQGEFVMTRIK